MSERHRRPPCLPPRGSPDLCGTTTVYTGHTGCLAESRGAERRGEAEPVDLWSNGAQCHRQPWPQTGLGAAAAPSAVLSPSQDWLCRQEGQTRVRGKRAHGGVGQRSVDRRYWVRGPRAGFCVPWAASPEGHRSQPRRRLLQKAQPPCDPQRCREAQRMEEGQRMLKKVLGHDMA